MANFTGLYYPYFTTKLRNIISNNNKNIYNNIFQAVMNFLSRKFCSLGNRSINIILVNLLDSDWLKTVPINWQASITFFHACERNSKCACKNTSYLDFVT